MAWMSVHEDRDGPKLRRLYNLLNCSKFEACGILDFIWIWGLHNADATGLLEDIEKEDLARYLYGAGAKCKLDMNQVVDALIATRWLDESPDGIYIHDWEEWQKPWYEAMRRRELDRDRKRERKKNVAVADQQQEESLQELQVQIAPKERQEEPPAPAMTEYTPGFAKFWEVYPRKEEKANAYKKYNARLHDGYSEEELLTAAQNYLSQCRREHTEKKYVKLGKTFLSDSLPFLDFLPKNRTVDVKKMNGNPFERFEDDDL